MGEVFSDSSGNLPQLTVEQARLKQLVDCICQQKYPNNLNLADATAAADPSRVQERLRQSSFSRLLLADGQSLSAEPAKPHKSESELLVGLANLTSVSLRAWSWNLEGTAGVRDEEYWAKKLDIRLRYSNGTQKAWQVLSAYTSSGSPETPALWREVVAADHTEMGYGSHGHAKLYGVQPENVCEFIDIAQDIFESS